MTEKPLVNLIQEEQLEGEAKEIFQAMKEKSGQVPKWMKVMANNPDILTGFFSMFKATMDNAPLDKKLKWKVAFLVSELNKCEFCVSVSKMQLKSFGLENMETVEAEDKKEELAFEYARAVNDHAYKIEPELIEKVKKEFNDAELVELTCVVGLFNYINRFNDALGVLPDLQ
ncbi:MAG TPA: hypothetical protein VKP03_02165 [Patescibacteria group bacterium]|nr:hypothetical protein [Patescibacteria group bacterium]